MCVFAIFCEFGSSERVLLSGVLIRSLCTGRCDGKRFMLEEMVVNSWQIISKCFGAAQPLSHIGRRQHKHLFGQTLQLIYKRKINTYQRYY